MHRSRERLGGCLIRVLKTTYLVSLIIFLDTHTDSSTPWHTPFLYNLFGKATIVVMILL